jgi:3,4-dihydroxy 2-butanone 4-phosphate synthase/GTP cyclohydrolase II
MIMDLRDAKALRQSCAGIPTPFGDFQLCVYRLALGDGTLLGDCGQGGPAYGSEIRVIFLGEVEGADGLMVRVHSECFTGEVLASLRCDCGDQLHLAMRMIQEEGRGMIIYLPQEGRGIGLSEKLKAYNLQDRGLDTVEANLELGHDADLRNYGAAALILRDFGIRSIRLMTNNPDKMDSLRRYGIGISDRLPLICDANPFNEKYLRTKRLKMNHILGAQGSPSAADSPRDGRVARPLVTLTYAQSLDGALAGGNGSRLILSGEQALRMTHSLRAENDAILVGIGTVLADDPKLTVRFAQGNDPRPVVLDSRLRIPADSFLASRHPLKPWIIATGAAPEGKRRELAAMGIRVFVVPADRDGRADLAKTLELLAANGIGSVMVEGGLEVIARFLGSGLVDRVVITISPRFTGGRRFPELEGRVPELVDVSRFQLGEDLVVRGRVKRP